MKSLSAATEIIVPRAKKVNPLPSKEYLEECFTYCAEMGKLFWKHRPVGHFKGGPVWGPESTCKKWNTRYAGTEAGANAKRPDGDGFNRVVAIRKKLYMAHRVIYSMLVEPIPEEIQIDHKDLNSLNNRIENLRLATNQQNGFNSPSKRGKQLGLPKGVFPNGMSGFQAKIKFLGKVYCLGTYTSPERASEAYMKKAIELIGEFARKG